MDFKATTQNEKTSIPGHLIVIGTNTGGPSALFQVIPKLSARLNATVIVVQEMRRGFSGLLARQLAEVSEITVREAAHDDTIAPGEVLIIPRGSGVTVANNDSVSGKLCRLQLENLGDSIDKHQSRIDRAMDSCESAYGKSTTGILLTGLGSDGMEGLRIVKHSGGKTIVQDESTSILFDKPKAAIDAGVADEIIPLFSIADRINELVGDTYANLIQKTAG